MKTKKDQVLVIDACQFSPSYNYCLLDSLARLDCSIIYATTKFAHDKTIYPENVRICQCFFLLARLVGMFSSAGSLRRFLRAVEYPFDWIYLLVYILLNNIRIVHFMWVVTPRADIYIVKLLKLLNRRIVYTAHNPFPHDHKQSDIDPYCRLYRETDKIIVLTEYSRKEILGKTAVSTDSIITIPHGDYESLFSQTGFNRELYDRVKKKAGSRRIITFLGGIRPYKGLDYFLEAIPLIRERSSDYFFLIAGSVVAAGGQEAWMDKLEQLGSDDVWADIRYIPMEDFKAYLELTDVLVQPYITASQSGNTIMAYTAGKPVISTDVGGLGEMTEHGKTGYVVPPRNAKAIAEAVRQCFENNQYEYMSAEAEKVAREKYCWTLIAGNTKKVYDSMATHFKGAAGNLNNG